MPLMTGVKFDTMCGGCAMHHKILIQYGYREDQPHYVCRSCIRALNRALDKLDKENLNDTQSSEGETTNNRFTKDDTVYI